ncbi:MAG: hypothetical protein OXI40_06210 [Chloroflexota bacterium]|nr:hypothetical protein [Chloroflexota bacterium]
MQSLPPSEYLALPKLALPASYICVLRDVDSGCYRIDKTQDPPGFIELVLAERDGDYGIELLAIVRASDLDAFEALLLERHDAALGGEWISLDDYQMAELRSSVLQINAYHSQYLTAQQHHHALGNAAATLDSVKRSSGKTRESGQVALEGGLSNRVGVAKQPRLRTRRRIRTRSELWNQEMSPEQAGLRQRIDDKINHLLVNHPVLVVAIVVLIALIALFTLDSTWRYPTVIP